MSDTIIVALITGSLSLIGVIITCYATNRKTKNDITEEYRKAVADLKEEFKVSQAITQTEIKELTREVREHNNFAKRMPVVENEIEHLVDDVHKLQKYHQ